MAFKNEKEVFLFIGKWVAEKCQQLKTLLLVSGGNPKTVFEHFTVATPNFTKQSKNRLLESAIGIFSRRRYTIEGMMLLSLINIK